MIDRNDGVGDTEKSTGDHSNATFKGKRKNVVQQCVACIELSKLCHYHLSMHDL